MHPEIQDNFAAVVVVGLVEFEDAAAPAQRWVGLKHFSPQAEGSWLDEADAEEFAEMFLGSTCLETFPAYQPSDAVRRAEQIARDRRLPLYRVTCFRDGDGTQHSVYELVEMKR
jgi:hypothetical protein